jgi:hypothetical protein
MQKMQNSSTLIRIGAYSKEEKILRLDKWFIFIKDLLKKKCSRVDRGAYKFFFRKNIACFFIFVDHFRTIGIRSISYSSRAILKTRLPCQSDSFF